MGLGVAIAWDGLGSLAAAAVTAAVAALVLRWVCVVAIFGPERVRVVNRLWSLAIAPSELAGVGLIGVDTWTGSRPTAVLLYLREGSAVPVIATASSGFGANRAAMTVADLYDVPVVVRAPRFVIDAQRAAESNLGTGRRSKGIYLAYLARAKSPDEAGIEFPVGLRRGWLKPRNLGMDPDSHYSEPELSTWLD